MTYIEPLLLLWSAATVLALLHRPPIKARRTAFCAVLVLILISWPPVDWLLAMPLVHGYPIRQFQPAPGIQAIVVLGSAVRTPQPERPYPLPDEQTFNRCEHAAWIYRRGTPVPVLACEGRPEQPLMRELLRRAGVPDHMIWLEDRSSSTHENAAYGAAILRRQGIHRIVLVVDVQSMLRAAACFRKEGLDVVAAPTDFRTLGAWQDELLPSWHAIRRNEITLHETLGLVWYRFRGWV